MWVHFYYYYLLAEIVFTSTRRRRRPQKLPKVTYAADRKLEIPTRPYARLPPPADIVSLNTTVEKKTQNVRFYESPKKS